MLVLTQKPGEEIVITASNGEVTRVLLMGFDYHHNRASRIRIGFDAPRSVVIDREVIHRRKLEEQGQ